MHLAAPRAFVFEPSEWCFDSQQTEFSLSSELLHRMKSLAMCLQRTLGEFADISNGDASQHTFTPPLSMIIVFLNLLSHSYAWQCLPFSSKGHRFQEVEVVTLTATVNNTST